jgi:hypothetical protein
LKQTDNYGSILMHYIFFCLTNIPFWIILTRKQTNNRSKALGESRTNPKSPNSKPSIIIFADYEDMRKLSRSICCSHWIKNFQLYSIAQTPISSNYLHHGFRCIADEILDPSTNLSNQSNNPSTQQISCPKS